MGGPATSLIKGNTTPISTNLNADAFFNSTTAPDANNATGNLPKAYLTIVFFNERFEYVSEGSTALRVMQAGDGADPLVIPNVKAPKNGYAYVYLSNESNETVYFDDFKVTDTRGRIIEEDHYYAFGLKIAGISSVKFGDPNEGMLANKNLYNDKELFDDADLNWYDYGFRNYDPQIGRFPQLDPLTWDYPELTNYQYASNEPIANVDMDGLEKIGVTTPGGIWNGSFLTPLASKSGAQIGEKIIQTAFKVGTSVANREFADNVIKKALEGGVKKVSSRFLKGSGLLIYLTFKPVATGKELTPAQLYKRLGYPQVFLHQSLILNQIIPKVMKMKMILQVLDFRFKPVKKIFQVQQKKIQIKSV